MLVQEIVRFIAGIEHGEHGVGVPPPPLPPSSEIQRLEAA
jgi:hypothetical protein